MREQSCNSYHCAILHSTSLYYHYICSELLQKPHSFDTFIKRKNSCIHVSLSHLFLVVAAAAAAADQHYYRRSSDALGVRADLPRAKKDAVVVVVAAAVAHAGREAAAAAGEDVADVAACVDMGTVVVMLLLQLLAAGDLDGDDSASKCGKSGLDYGGVAAAAAAAVVGDWGTGEEGEVANPLRCNKEEQHHRSSCWETNVAAVEMMATHYFPKQEC